MARKLGLLVGALFSLAATLPAQAVSFSLSAAPYDPAPGAILFYDFDGVQNTGVGVFAGGGVLNSGVNPGGGGNWLGLAAYDSLTFVNPVSYVGFLWGTTDSYNDLLVFNGSTLLASYSGAPGGFFPAVTPGQTTTYFNLFAGPGEVITSLVFASNYAFETDNYAYIAAQNPVPLPAALPLLATGLGIAGLLGYRRKSKQAAALRQLAAPVA